MTKLSVYTLDNTAWKYKKQITIEVNKRNIKIHNYSLSILDGTSSKKTSKDIKKWTRLPTNLI